MKNIPVYFAKHHIKPSYQRIKIYEYLLASRSHPTADDIYRQLVQTIPTLSKTTVYNSLKTFVDKGIINEITIQGNEMRYDAIKERHGHFQCEICKEIYDFPLDEFLPYEDELKGFEIRKSHVHLKGVCKKCHVEPQKLSMG